jgi:uncharacterized membrane protein
MNLNITFKRLITYFFQGIIYMVPVVATAFILVKVFFMVDGLLPFEIPGIGIIVIVVTLTFLGYIGNLIIAQPIVNFISYTLSKTPVINGIYSAIKDILSAFVGKEKKFNQPVLVRVNNISNLEKIGFITREDLSEVGLPTNKIAVYFPHSYAFSGELYIVPAEFITPIDKNSADVMKFIVSGGVVNM